MRISPHSKSPCPKASGQERGADHERCDERSGSYIPMQFTIEALDEKIPTKISLPEKLAERFCEKFGCKKGNFSTGIKIEIRKCIRKNLKISSVKRFSSAEITAAFDEAFHRISEKGEILDGRRDKNERVQRKYRWAFNAMLDTLTNSIKKGS